MHFILLHKMTNLLERIVVNVEYFFFYFINFYESVAYLIHDLVVSGPAFGIELKSFGRRRSFVAWKERNTKGAHTPTTNPGDQN